MNKLKNDEIMEIVFQVAESQNLYYERSDFTPLCHYTTGVGLNGILHSKTLRANHASSLNDVSEIIRAYEILSNILNRRTNENANLNLVLGEIKKDLDIRIKNKIYPDIFIVSFSKKKDDLFLWRSYTSFNDAYSLVFTKAFIASYCGSVGAELLHCIYNESKQIAIFELVLDLFLRKIEKFSLDNLAEATEGFFNIIHLFVPFIKNPHFEDEEEIRLVLRNPRADIDENRIKLGLNKNNFYSYVNLPIVRNEANESFEHALEEIIIGPNSRYLEEKKIFDVNFKELINQNIGNLLKGFQYTKFNTLRF
ncbi:DUF2971 domain-containing protein [Leptospira mtsangambouensis]|uniref:DUF2971 domain-containing protein n=1 Tax=Leptospira mtsangambouensis TaxID=2484912 RepID=A0ABY2P3D8_9LEPT|nr:DUF2971 domain-containing protein [Leptospira mtsangambouensis]TGM81981.1 DUF2971 domain-containing protein [Leptospira mtsangambouensis]